jgi:hypothetical protein
MLQSPFLRPASLLALLAASGLSLPVLAANAPAATTPATTPAAKALPPNYNAIYEQNMFDPQRKPWEEKKEVPPPLPPLTSEDVQIYGVMAVGSYKRAIVKLGGKLRGMAPSDPKARPFVTLAEGQSLAGYTLAEIGPQRLVFSVGDIRYAVAFNKKEDRPTAPPPPPPPVFQEAVIVAAETPNGSNGQPLPAAVPAGQEAAPAAAPAAVAAPEQQAAAPAPVAAAPGSGESGNAANNTPPPAPAQPMSLLDAIQQAKAAQSGGQPAAAAVNPFTNLGK